jgi:plasmid stabilization system protein ParE
MLMIICFLSENRKNIQKQPGGGFEGLMSAIYSLETMPRRCAVIPEAEDFLYEYRQLIFHSHRIIFHIDEKRNAVIVLRVYHGSRERIRIEELGIPPY